MVTVESSREHMCAVAILGLATLPTSRPPAGPSTEHCHVPCSQPPTTTPAHAPSCPPPPLLMLPTAHHHHCSCSQAPTTTTRAHAPKRPPGLWWPQEGLHMLHHQAVVLDGLSQLLGRLHMVHSTAWHGMSQHSTGTACLAACVRLGTGPSCSSPFRATVHHSWTAEPQC